ncbi:fructoselysine-6-P-deglycase FrlB-like protein [Kribbella antiqua]|uniref:Fructoselysine-6-P-deglycase FrlB-like protein n=1 Tax=Kribbella antiqua TaxID=2512217 RepID=A0A4R2IIA4_9ACTN|nr:SIS domain-containing protein [Kribbella antiqua]TCO44012.1 fructoselysine-6-P-deglycase FrlB-like protein [Kribbella antiqua]
MSITARLTAALDTIADVQPMVASPLPQGAVFVGSGDSLSSALLATSYGHRAMSSGDITWMGALPAATDAVVGISHSGTSGATVQALRIARAAGARVAAITSNPDSPLAAEADELQLVPSLGIDEEIPVGGHLMLGLGVAAVCGQDTTGAARQLAKVLSDVDASVEEAIGQLPGAAPTGISVLTLPDLRGAGDFFMLKLIEATGVSVRTVALEESGHVDYFIGPQPHVVLQLIGGAGQQRFDRLQQALEHAGQTVLQIQIGSADGLLRELSGAVFASLFAGGAAKRWGRPPFRGGAVNMDASHIKLDGWAVSTPDK